MSGLDSLIHKVDVLRLNLEVQVLYNKNLECFKKYLPPVYECFSTYVPQELTVKLDQQGNLNICNIQNGSFVYSEAPFSFSEKQYALYKKKPLTRSIFFEGSHAKIHERYLHTNYMKKLLENYSDIKSKEELVKESLPESIRFMVVMGIGSGHHLLQLIKHHDIRNLCLYDPHLDALFNSMHMVDWEPILEYFDREGYSLELCIGEPGHDCMKRLGEFFQRNGIFNIARVYLYKHYNSEDISQLEYLLKNEMSNLSVGIGFYDDERISLSHTVSNYLQNLPIARVSLSQRKQFAGCPCVIIGNGPSLDLCEDFLIKNKDNLVIISSGTSLQTLEKMGLKPDIHIEQERPHITFEWLKKYQDGDYLKDITFIGLNTVYPKLSSLFKESYIISKPNDIGTDWLVSRMEQIEGNTLALADFCNPTVTNAAASIALTLGFNELYLAGVDLGMVDFDKHHASKSAYFHLMKDLGNRYRKEPELKDKGNFRDEVYTTMVLQTSRIIFENMFDKWKPNVYNLNDGAFIRGAKPAHASELPLIEQKEEKSQVLKEQLGKVFSLKQMRPIESKNEAYKIFFDLKNICDHFVRVFNTEVKSVSDVMDVLNKAFKSLQSVREQSISYRLLSGSINYALVVISSVVLHLKEGRDVGKIYANMADNICGFLQLVPKDFETNFYKVSGEEVDFLPPNFLE
ncbi:6-hydroxymethylpterin diphosphokinase MptE-like protein [Neptuniibacter sp.]|uniref:motility associated factor glycosyltransferase family protein n=1 Tax=Neptuniibacter sp. TaxID=1962643 RepID=UPI0026147612|nr:6-hydroxymethylpterin diphosphokinase MptE-like protein [Neptuniibacter sp.]MCP4595917.1 motility associated factor glycosyltransferase family protein [Neptuniibacter sp.]